MNGDGTRFNWGSVLTAASLGLVFAALSITGALPDFGSTRWVALALLVIIGTWIGTRVSYRVAWHGFAAGLIAGLLAVETQALFMDAYLSNNPQYADAEIPFGWSPRLATAVLGPINALIAGVIAGVTAWLVGLLARIGSVGPAQRLD